MIYEVEGDILLSRAQVIVQGVGLNDPMTMGLARKLQERFPVMREHYRQWCEEETRDSGQAWHWRGSDKSQVVNLIIAGPPDPELNRSSRPDKIALHRSLRKLGKMALDLRFTSMAMPKLASGYGGLDWLEVREMINSQLGELLFPIFVYVEDVEGQVASEPGM